jgi:inorganic pyrophosphatase
VLLDEPVPVGSLVPCRLVGVVAAEQRAAGARRTVRNDRLLGVATASQRYRDTRLLADLRAELLEEIERFFIDCDRARGVLFHPLGRHGPREARRLLQQARRRFDAAR